MQSNKLKTREKNQVKGTDGALLFQIEKELSCQSGMKVIAALMDSAKPNLMRVL